MKRLLLLPVLMLGISFACDQPYEEVAGIKIGCPIGSSVDYREYDSGGQIYGGGAVFRKLKGDNFFQSEVVLSLDGVVEGIILGTGDDSATEEDFRALVESMEGRWGESMIKDNYSGSSAFFFNHDSQIIEMIGVSFSKGKKSLTSVYRTQKSLEAEDLEKEREDALRRGQFKGL